MAKKCHSEYPHLDDLNRDFFVGLVFTSLTELARSRG